MVLLGIIVYMNNPSLGPVYLGASLIIGLLLFDLLALKKKRNNIIFVSIVLLTLILFSFIYKNHPDKSVFELTNLEKHEIASRRDYMRIGLMGQIYGRKIGNYYFEKVMVYKMKGLRKIAIPMDISQYFGNQPKPIFSYLFLPVFVTGFFILIKDKLRELLIYLLLIIPLTIPISAEKSIIFYIPLFFTSFAMGIKDTYSWILSKRNKKT